ncbi:MAG TPA: hypothetical protein VMK13_04390, partial [Streptosporangiaceae bacterium]|nr:hypothetical protein [Streptosporangiaceae bacterium]
AASCAIIPRGPFSLAEAATFGFGQRDGQDWDGVMRLAFCLDGYQDQAGVELRQDPAGEVHAGCSKSSPFRAFPRTGCSGCTA